METPTKNKIKYLIVPLLLCLLAVQLVSARLNPDFLMHVDFLDVGQGDSIFIQTYQGNQILIDGGPGNSVLQKLGEDMPFWDRKIEMVILTHAHLDHVGGLVDVLKRYKVGAVVLPEVIFESGAYDEFLSLVEEKKIKKVYARTGQRIHLDQATVFDVFYPFGGLVSGDLKEGFGTSSSQLNDTSVVGKLTFGRNKILFTGDSGVDIESKILPLFDLDADVLKVGHHGSRHSTSQALLEEVTPYAAVIGVGKNNYGHPTTEVLQVLEQAGVKTYRTDQDGTVRFVSDGINLYRR